MPSGVYIRTKPVWNKGKKGLQQHTQKWKDNMSKIMKGRKLTKEWVEKIRLSNTKPKRKNICKFCNQKFENYPFNKKAIFCSQKCMGEFMKGKNHHHWKGGKKKSSHGYIVVYKPKHPFCNKGKYIYEHRLVMEKYLGRYLTKNEHIHHKNGNRSDNRPENLHLYINGKNWHPCLCPKCGFDFLVR